MREIVGYERYDTPEAVAWLNEVYALLDAYVSLFLPMRKVVFKERKGAKVKKRYDIAQTPFQRLIEKDVLNNDIKSALLKQYQTLNPLALHRQLENLLTGGPLDISNNLTLEKEPSPTDVRFHEKQKVMC